MIEQFEHHGIIRINLFQHYLNQIFLSAPLNPQFQILLILFMGIIDNFFLSILLLPQVLSQFCQPPTPNSPSTISLQSCGTFYQLAMDVGTPPQQFIFLIDTGSLWTWVPTTSCYCGSGINVEASASSKMSSTPHNITYADGDTVSGFEGTDTFTIRNTVFSNINASMVFVTVKRAPLMGNRGLVALGYSENNIFDSAFSQGKISTSAFIIRLSDTFGMSKIYFDKLPAEMVQKSIYTPILTSMHLWAIRCYGVKVEDEDFTKFTKGVTIVDSGTTITALNRQLYDKIVLTYFNNCQSTNQQSFKCPPSIRPPTIQFYLQGNVVFLDPAHYTVSNFRSTEVYLSVSDNIILGTSFFKKYAVTFDKTNDRIGFFGESRPLTVIGDDFFYRSSIAMIAILGLVGLLAIISAVFRSCFVPSYSIPPQVMVYP